MFNIFSKQKITKNDQECFALFSNKKLSLQGKLLVHFNYIRLTTTQRPILMIILLQWHLEALERFLLFFANKIENVFLVPNTS